MYHQNQDALISHSSLLLLQRSSRTGNSLSSVLPAQLRERKKSHPWEWHNKCASTVIVTKLLVIKQAVWKDLLPFFPHKACPTWGKGMLLSMGQFCSIIWQHDFAYQFFFPLPPGVHIHNFKSNLQHVKVLKETLKNLMYEVNHWHDLLLKFHGYNLTIKKYW